MPCYNSGRQDFYLRLSIPSEYVCGLAGTTYSQKFTPSTIPQLFLLFLTDAPHAKGTPVPRWSAAESSSAREIVTFGGNPIVAEGGVENTDGGRWHVWDESNRIESLSTTD
mmetsp:Transcript_10632/g.31417  ORF Transcript_10632/g.31417 Transcript_10632/m.31417 type:complete len:111 (-) Transcript_10632:279-611(-)